MTKAKKREELSFHVEEILDNGLSGRRVLQPSWFSLPPESDDPIQSIKLSEPILVDFHLERVGREVRLDLSLNSVATLTCARCLKAFPFPVQTESQFTLCEASEQPTLEKEMELALESLESGTYEGDEIDLSNLIYEQIVLSFPIKPLCRGDCKGLCPQCGMDRNLEDCGCESTSSDPRWEALRRLRTS